MPARPLARPLARPPGRPNTSGIGAVTGGGGPYTTGWWFDGSALDLDFQNNLGAVNSNPVPSALSQLTLTRTTVGYAQSAITGLWTSFASGQFRQTDKGLLVEEARTNNLLRCRDMTNAAWVKGATMTAALTQTGIDGAANSASLLTGGAVSATNTVLQTITLGSSADTYSVFLKRVTGSGVVNISADGSTWTPVTLTTTYQQFQVQQTLANPVCGIQIITNGDQVAADFSQLEVGGFATSPILTTTVAATRNADRITVNNFGLISMAGGSVFVEWLENAGPAGTNRRLLSAGADANNQLVMGVDTGNHGALVVKSGGVNQTVSSTSSNPVVAGVVYRMAESFAFNNSAVAFTSSLNAAAITDASVTLPVGSTTSATIGSEQTSAINFTSGYMRRVASFPLNLNASTLISWAQGNTGP